MGQQTGDQTQLLYLFNLVDRIPADHLQRRINPIVTAVLTGIRIAGEAMLGPVRSPSGQ